MPLELLTQNSTWNGSQSPLPQLPHSNCNTKVTHITTKWKMTSLPGKRSKWHHRSMEIIFTLADTRLPICLLQVDTLPEWQAKTTMGIRSTANLSDLPPKEQVSLCIFFMSIKPHFHYDLHVCEFSAHLSFIWRCISAMNYFTVNVRMPSWWEHSLFIFWARHWIMQISKWKTFTIFYWLCGTFSQISLFYLQFQITETLS